jgi:hypothetical protein
VISEQLCHASVAPTLGVLFSWVPAHAGCSCAERVQALFVGLTVARLTTALKSDRRPILERRIISKAARPPPSTAFLEHHLALKAHAGSRHERLSVQTLTEHGLNRECQEASPAKQSTS